LLRRYGIHRSPKSLGDALRKAIEQAHTISRKRGIDYPEVAIDRIWRQVLGSDDRQQIAAFALEYELIVNPVYPMPGLDALLLACSAQHVPMGIISNAQFFTPVLLEYFLGATLARRGFDSRLIFFSYRFGCAKPSDVMFTCAKDALSSMGIVAASTLYVGNDMRNDILPAKSVGFKTALFAGDRRSLRRRGSDDRCKNLSPDLVVTDLLQLVNGAVNP
jgi:putative hydrolase of the HAD superfamily